MKSNKMSILRRRLACCSAGLLLSTAGVAFAQTDVPTIDQLAAFPAMSSFSLSPDGKHLVALRAIGENQVIVVYDTADLSKPPVSFGSGSMKVASVSFLKDDVIGVSLWQPFDLTLDRTTKTFIGKFYLVDLNGRNWRDPMPVENRVTDDIGKLQRALSNPDLLDKLPADPDHVLLEQGSGSHQGDIFKVDVHSGRSVLVLHSSDKASGYVVDLGGDIRARSRTSVDAGGAYVTADFRVTKSAAWTEQKKSYAKKREIFAVAGFSKDPNIAYVISNEGRDKQAIYEYDITQRKLGELAFEHKFFDASDVDVWRYKDENFGEIIGFKYQGPREDEYYVSPRFVALQEGLEKALSVEKQPLRLIDTATGAAASTSYPQSRYLRIESYSRDLSKVLVWVGGPNDPGAYYLLHDQHLDLLSRPYPSLDPAVLGTTKLVYYKARDGLDIPAFLTTPSTTLYGKGPWPTVILPHGGPWSRDHLEWDWSMWPQLLASRGYAILQPQYRGSDGWGARLWRAGDGEWGGKMQDDKDDGAKWLIAQNIAKPDHIAMFGFSYGGYAAFDAAVRPNGIYKCAIAGAGVSDIRRIWADFYQNPIFRDSQEPTVRGTSPVDFAGKIGIPIMVYAGDRDQTVPIEQSHWFVDKAKAAGKDVVFHELPDYAHGPAWTRAIFGQQLGYIDDYLRNGCGGHGL
jgi:dipeptidyl aminopeptidase/acylaminoacyl peptidase